MYLKNTLRLAFFTFSMLFLFSNVYAKTIVDPKYDVSSCNWTNSRTVVVGNTYTHTEEYWCTRVRDGKRIITATGTKTIDLNTANDYVCNVNARSPYIWKSAAPGACFLGTLVEPTITVSTPVSCGVNAGKMYDSYVLPTEMNYQYSNARNYCSPCPVSVKPMFSGSNTTYFILGCES